MATIVEPMPLCSIRVLEISNTSALALRTPMTRRRALRSGPTPRPPWLARDDALGRPRRNFGAMWLPVRSRPRPRCCRPFRRRRRTGRARAGRETDPRCGSRWRPTSVLPWAIGTMRGLGRGVEHGPPYGFVISMPSKASPCKESAQGIDVDQANGWSIGRGETAGSFSPLVRLFRGKSCRLGRFHREWTLSKLVKEPKTSP